MEQYLVRLSKEMSKALRHIPRLYGLELDPQGWVSTEALIKGIEDRRNQAVTLEDFQRVLEQSDKQRFEIKDGRIRALYGHSVKDKLVKEPDEPPAVLYHGTNPAALHSILKTGLKPMRRQYVHLSPDGPTATQVARRKGEPLILEIDAAGAYRAGHNFYRGNDMVWLADAVPPEFIKTPGK